MSFRSTALLILLLRQNGLFSHAWQPILSPFSASSTLSRVKSVGPPKINTHCSFLRAASSSAATTRTDEHEDVSTTSDVSVLLQGRPSKQVWRPDKQDVERISWGKPAKKKGTGSRGVPHRINQEERLLFDQARSSKGFLEVAGSAWRSQRRDAPLVNTYRSWCDACAQPCIIVHKSSTGVDDAVVLDISPLRLEYASEFQAVASACMAELPGGSIQSQGGSNIYEGDDDDDNDDTGKADDKASNLLLDTDSWETRPIYQLPPYCIVWDSLQRSEAKAVAKTMATFCQTATKNKGREKKSKKPVGVKPGKGRRHGGYGIG